MIGKAVGHPNLQKYLLKAMKAQKDGDWFKAVSRYFKAVNTLKTGGDIKTEFLHQNEYDCLVYS